MGFIQLRKGRFDSIVIVKKGRRKDEYTNAAITAAAIYACENNRMIHRKCMKWNFEKSHKPISTELEETRGLTRKAMFRIKRKAQ